MCVMVSILHNTCYISSMKIVPLNYVFFLHIAEFLPPFQCYIACVMICSHGNIVPNETKPSLLFAKYYTKIYAQIGSNTSFTFNKIVASPPR